jgi:purine-binding chemotaxis protein CheW
MTGAKLYTIFILAGQEYCIDITQVRENRRWSSTTTLPHSPSYMMGTMNLRGEVIPVIDLAALFGFSAIKPTTRHVIIVVEHEQKIIGLAVEAVRRILSVAPDDIREVPGDRTGADSSCIRGLVMSETGMIRIIDAIEVLNCMQESI